MRPRGSVVAFGCPPSVQCDWQRDLQGLRSSASGSNKASRPSCCRWPPPCFPIWICSGVLKEVGTRRDRRRCWEEPRRWRWLYRNFNGCLPPVSRSEYFFILVHLRCFDGVFSVTACLILYVDTVGFAYYRYVFVVRYSCLSKPLEKYFRSWQRRRLSYFFSSGAVWEFCVSSDRGDAGGYFLFPVWWIWTLLARDGGFLLELICFIVQLMNFEIF